MEWVFAAVSGIVFVELFLRLSVAEKAKNLLHTGKKVTSVIASKKISDHWKEKVVLQYALRMFLGTLQLAALLIISFLPILFLVWLDHLLNFSFLDFMQTITGILFTTVIAVVYAKLKFKRV